MPRTRAFAQPSGFRGLQQLNEQSSLPAVRQRHAQGSGQLSVGNLHSAVQPKTPQGHPHSPQTPSRIGKRQGSPAVRSSLRTPQQRSPQHEREAASNSVLQGPTTTQVRPPRHTATREQQSTEHRRRTATVSAAAYCYWRVMGADPGVIWGQEHGRGVPCRNGSSAIQGESGQLLHT